MNTRAVIKAYIAVKPAKDEYNEYMSAAEVQNAGTQSSAKKARHETAACAWEKEL